MGNCRILRRRAAPLWLAVVLSALFGLSDRAYAQDFRLLNHVIGNGGGQVAGTEFTVLGTIGQPLVCVVSNETFQIESGVWHDGQGILVTEIADDIQPISGLPSKFHLGQNYPNPFNPTTTIAFEIPRREHVKLKLYNILGQVVATLVNGELSAGTYEVAVNGQNLSSGVYLYRIEAAEFVESKKLVLLK